MIFTVNAIVLTMQESEISVIPPSVGFNSLGAFFICALSLMSMYLCMYITKFSVEHICFIYSVDLYIGGDRSSKSTTGRML